MKLSKLILLSLIIGLLTACGSSADKPHKPPVYQSAKSIEPLQYPVGVAPLPKSSRYEIPELPQDEAITTPYDERGLVNPPDLLGDLLPAEEQSARQK